MTLLSVQSKKCIEREREGEMSGGQEDGERRKGENKMDLLRTGRRKRRNEVSWDRK